MTKLTPYSLFTSVVIMYMYYIAMAHLVSLMGESEPDNPWKYYKEDITQELIIDTLDQTMEENNSEQLAYALLAGFSIAGVINLITEFNQVGDMTGIIQWMFILILISGFLFLLALLCSVITDEAGQSLKKHIKHLELGKEHENHLEGEGTGELFEELFDRIAVLRNSPQRGAFTLGLLGVICALACAGFLVSKGLGYISVSCAVLVIYAFYRHLEKTGKNMEDRFLKWEDGYDGLDGKYD